MAMMARLAAAWGGDAPRGEPSRPRHQGRLPGMPALRRGVQVRLHRQGRLHRLLQRRFSCRRTSSCLRGRSSCRQLSWKWREFFDRSFFNTHTPSLVGKQFAFLVSGPLSLLPELRETYEGMGRAPAVEPRRPSSPTRPRNRAFWTPRWTSLPSGWSGLRKPPYIRPQTFLGVAGMKIFRDDIWSELKVVFRADHKAYKRLGFYDFPQRRIGQRILMGLAWFVTGLPGDQEPVPFDDQDADDRAHAPRRAEGRGLRRSADERHATHPRVVFPRQDGYSAAREHALRGLEAALRV